MILRKLKQLLGMGSETEETGRSERDVVVQEESTGADTETEAAVKGVDEGASAEAAEEPDVGSGEVDEPVATATDADASTESLVDEAETQEHPESRAEPAEAAGPGAEDETTDMEEADAETDAADVEDTVADATAEEPDIEAEEGTDVDQIKGIGPAYSDRLDEVDIHNVAQLAAADPAELADRTTVSEKTVRKWVDRAQAFEE